MDGRQHHANDAPSMGVRSYAQMGRIWFPLRFWRGFLDSERRLAYPENGEVLGRLSTQPLQTAGGKPIRPAWDRPNDGPEMREHLRAVAFWAITQPASSRNSSGPALRAQAACYDRDRACGARPVDFV